MSLSGDVPLPGGGIPLSLIIQESPRAKSAFGLDKAT